MKRFIRIVLLGVWLSSLILPLTGTAGIAAPAEQSTAPATPVPSGPDSAEVRALMAKMSPDDRVGQLFVVTFMGNDISDGSDIATLVRDYRVGGVVLLPENDNFRASASPAGKPTETPAENGTAAAQIFNLANRLQVLATSPAQAITPTLPVTATVSPTQTQRARPLSNGETPSDTLNRSAPGQSLRDTVTATTAARTPTPAAAVTGSAVRTGAASAGPHVPLLIGLDWTGDGGTPFGGNAGFSPMPSQMAIGATWAPDLARKVGAALGQEITAAGVNLLLGPSLDVLDAPRPGSGGDLRTRTFGGDPFWTGQMGRAFIRGVQEGSSGSVMTVAKHFPGQGAADRRPEDEVSTVQKSLQQLRQIELAPFAAVSGGDLSAPGITGALMTSHIRYRGLQGNIRQLTPPISLAPQLGDLMAQKEFADWRAAGGILMSDALGVPAVRRYYDPQLQKFPDRQVAQDAFLAGNDLLYLSRFALTDNWPDQYQAIRGTILYFRNKYHSDSEFRARVDASVERILKMKRRIYKKDWSDAALLHDTRGLTDRVGTNSALAFAVARASTTLIYPGRDELADRLPSAPLADENILIFTDAREGRDCAGCPAAPVVGVSALQDIMLRLYGPSGTGQVPPGHVRSLSFADLDRLMAAPPGQEKEIESAIAKAQWILFAQQDNDPTNYPASAALRTFLAKRSDSLRDKRLVVLSLDAPYYLDTTEVSKLTAYFGVYSKSGPFLETAVRALFREFSPIGAPPVSVSGINYDLIRALEPAPGQIIGLGAVGGDNLSGLAAGLQVGSKLQLQTGIIMDRNGHPVPDGTLVEFHLRYPVEGLQLAPQIETTSGGQARTTITLDRQGELWITAQASEAKDSARIVLKIGGGDTPGSIATVLPSPTVPASPTPTVAPSPTATPEPSVTPPSANTPTSSLGSGRPRVALAAFLYGLVGVLLASASAFRLRCWRMEGADRDQQTVTRGVPAALWAAVTAWAAYLLYSFGLLPGATALQASGNAWAAGLVTFLAGLLSLLWSGERATKALKRLLS
ncbi:MAG TPA: glycoside hydrolase family 3 N-terminal domain-containing protein [Anaerolineae bacterium]